MSDFFFPANQFDRFLDSSRIDGGKSRIAMPTVSIVIVNFNRCSDLREALKSVYMQTVTPKEVIVVDNASTDDSVAMLRKEFPTVHVHEMTENVGMDGYSIACRMSTADYIFQMDNDSLMPDSNVLELVLGAFASAPADVAILATRVEEVRGDISLIDKVRFADKRTGVIKTFGYHAGGVAFKKRLMDEVGYYNRDVFLYGAELFVQLNTIAKGYTLLYAPGIFMVHRGSPVARSEEQCITKYAIDTGACAYSAHSSKIVFHSTMIIHDLIYSLHKGALRTGLKAIIEGLGRLPPSLSDVPDRRSSDLAHAVSQLGSGIGLASLLHRILRRGT